MERHTVDAPGRRCSVQVYQVAKHVWVADGEALGDQLRVRGNTSGKALIAWHKAAAKRGANDGVSAS
jgi:hypothetical protein